MKAINYFLFISLIAFSFSCKKHKESNVTKKIKVCNNSFLAVKSVSVTLVNVSASGEDINTYTLPSGFFGYNKNENCVYSIRFKDTTGEIYLYRFGLENKKLDTLTAISPTEFFEPNTGWNFVYNDVVNKFYASYFNYYHHSYFFGTDEVSISGNTFTYNHPHLPIRPLSVQCINEWNGDVYFDHGTTFSPLTNTVRQIPINLELNNVAFNPNDSMLYGILYESNSTAYRSFPTKLYKLNPNTGDTKLITTLPVPAFDQVYCSTFDVCNNQYVMQAGDSNAKINMYWIDVKTGSISKIVPSKEAYTALIYTPE